MALAVRSRIVSVPARRVAALAVPRPTRPAKTLVAPARRADAFKVQASNDADFDTLLNSWADKFEKVENKPVAIAWIIAAFGAFFTTEWLIHLPGLNFLLGFPIQTLGVLVTPILALRYLVDKKSVTGDLEDAVNDVSKILPGLKK